MKNDIFWHVCGINNYIDVTQEQWHAIASSGLIDKIDKIYLTYLGKDRAEIQWLLDKHPKITLQNFHEDIKHYERLCLMSLLDYSKNTEANILYIHAKGVSRPDNPHIQDWRRMMEHFLIHRHERCLELIKDYDALGILVCNSGNGERITNENHKFHFSGNFWWSKTSYLRNLPSLYQSHINDLSHNCRWWLCETWLLHAYPNVKMLELYKDANVHFYKFSPDLKYLNHSF
jgi:hypothetical protein